MSPTRKKPWEPQDHDDPKLMRYYERALREGRCPCGAPAHGIYQCHSKLDGKRMTIPSCRRCAAQELDTWTVRLISRDVRPSDAGHQLTLEL